MSAAGTPEIIRHADFDAAIFDMDGVITDTARLHAAAWKRLLDEFLSTQPPNGGAVRPFIDDDYRRYVDGRARVDGVESFLASRGIQLERGDSSDAPESASAWGLATGRTTTSATRSPREVSRRSQPRWRSSPGCARWACTPRW